MMAQRRENFWSRYSKFCLKNKVYPSRSVIKAFKSTELSLLVEAIREHWKYVLPALLTDNSLTKVHFASCVSPHDEDDDGVKLKSNKRWRFPTPFGRSEKNINTMTLAIAGLLHSSETLIILKLENLLLKNLDAEQLAMGLSQSSYLKFFSLSGCRFEEGAVSIICRGLTRSCVSWIDFSSCALTLPEIEAISNVIKSHNVRRSHDIFPNTLRFVIPHLKELPGLNRVSLNYNSLEDEALNILIESLADDRWIKAVDLQNCDIEDEGAEALINLAKSNATIILIDVRLNEIDEHLLSRLAQQLALNKVGKDIKYMELPLWRPSELTRKYNAIGKVKVSKKPSAHKLKTTGKTAKSCNNSVKPPQPIQDKSNNIKDAYVQTSFDKAKDLPKALQDLVNDMRTKLQNEMKLKKFFLSKYNQIKAENEHLRSMIRSQNDDIYIDQETYYDIKHTFEKLKIFFDVMKKYGLWEYISLLGFDETTDVVMEENDAQKCVKVIRNDSHLYHQENTDDPHTEICCNCRKASTRYKEHVVEANDLPDGAQNSLAAPNAKPSLNKGKTTLKDDPLNERVAYRLLQEVMNDYTNVSSHHQVLNTKPASGRMPETVSVPQDNVKPSGSKQSGSTSPKASSGAHMLIKKFSYSNMPKQLKELVTPADFYNIVKKELERCESEARRPFSSSIQTENSTPANSNAAYAKPNLHKKPNYKTEVNTVPPSRDNKETSTRSHRRASVDDEHDNLTISELIAREKAAKQAAKKESAKSSTSSIASSKIHKNSNHAKIRETKSFIKSEQMLPKSKLKLSSPYQTSSQTTSKKVQSRSNVSSDEINSSDSVVTASDQLSHSSVSSSSSNKSHDKSSSDHTDSEPQKSYLESVSDASTFKDVESISDIEIASQVLSLGASEMVENMSKDKGASSVKAAKDDSISSQSSTLKGATESKNKPNESTVSGPSSLKDASQKSDKSTKTSTPSQGKTKHTNKHNNKNRPKSNSSKSSSVPSLSDITTVSSRSLNTDSVMKQISASEDNSKGGK